MTCMFSYKNRPIVGSARHHFRLDVLRDAQSAAAQATYSYTGGTYTQSFDTLPVQSGASVNASTAPVIGGITYNMTVNGTTAPVSFTDTTIGSGGHAIASGMAGWWTAGSVADQLGASYGDQTKGGVISFGTSGSANRAVGLIATSTSGIDEVGMNLVNATGGTLDKITLGYTGELWLQQTLAKTLNFGYYLPLSGTGSLTAAVGNSTPDVNLNVGFATGVANSGASGPLNSSPLSDTINLATPWAPGTSLWLTWQISSSAGSGQGLALDNLSFSGTEVVSPSTDTWATTSGTWDLTTGNWTGGTPVGSLYKDGDSVIFGNLSSSATVTVAPGGVSPGSITISNSSNTYTFTGGAIGGGGSSGLSKSGNGAVILMSSNTYTGGTSITGGTLVVAAGDSSLGAASGAISISNGATLQTTNAGIISGRNITFGPGGATFNTNSLSSSTSGTVTMNGPFTVSGGGNLAIKRSLIDQFDIGALHDRGRHHLEHQQ